MAMRNKRFVKHGYDTIPSRMGYRHLSYVETKTRQKLASREKHGARIIGREELKKRLMRDLKSKKEA